MNRPFFQLVAFSICDEYESHDLFGHNRWKFRFTEAKSGDRWILNKIEDSGSPAIGRSRSPRSLKFYAPHHQRTNLDKAVSKKRTIDHFQSIILLRKECRFLS